MHEATRIKALFDLVSQYLPAVRGEYTRIQKQLITNAL